ncbi:HIT family protein [Streptomyces sp. NBC_01439]|uniref:HIT family protein n=1 Tax=Streptomyces sp. NBC_01439 TaxID=2903867 RepID=UPI002E2E2CBD|nr:HIT family protein [Streptomyces sp. NBC_01439]
MDQRAEDRSAAHGTGGGHDRPAHGDCPFCRIVRGAAPAHILRDWPGALAISPRGGGVTPGHVLVLPKTHVPDVAADPAVSAMTMLHAAEVAGEVGDCNVITSRGAAATQTVPHLHVHVVPRRHGDGIALPWTTSPTGDGPRRPGRERPPWTAPRPAGR